MSNATLDFFEEYRAKVAETGRIKTQIHNLERETLKRNLDLRELQQEVVAMQKIITLMVDKGWDPVEAKLRTDESDRQRSFWPGMNDMFDDGKSTLSIALSPIHTTASVYAQQYKTGATGATGATGDTGAYGSQTYLQYPPGANGSTGGYNSVCQQNKKI